MESCPKCGKPVVVVPLFRSVQHLTLDAEPASNGTVIILDGKAHYLNGWKLYNLVRESNIPKYTRHYVRGCPRVYPKHPMLWTEKEFRDDAERRAEAQKEDMT